MKPWDSPAKAKANYSKHPSTIGGINRLTDEEKQAIYTRVLPTELLKKYEIDNMKFESSSKKKFRVKVL